jgi:SpoVK/Ycf46/Vps4 family AAA+-type ATPase
VSLTTASQLCCGSNRFSLPLDLADTAMAVSVYACRPWPLRRDGLRTAQGDRVLVLAATNRPADLDEAVVRRLPRRLLVDLPDAVNRARILKVTAYVCRVCRSL